MSCVVRALEARRLNMRRLPYVLVVGRAVVKAASGAALAGCLLVSCWIGEAGAQSQTTDRAALVALYHATGGPNWTNKANWLSGEPIGEWYGVTTDAAGRVTRLTLVNNNLTGSLPVGLGTLSSLKSLSLFRNQLSGSIPVELGNLSKLQFLQLQENNLTGPIPSELGGLQDLRLLSLRSNQLTGSIPSELGDLQELTGLYLGSNRLTGPIPPSLAYLSNLRGSVPPRQQPVRPDTPRRKPAQPRAACPFGQQSVGTGSARTGRAFEPGVALS